MTEQQIAELAAKYKALLDGSDVTGYGRTERHKTLIFVEQNQAELSKLNLDQQMELVRLAGADPSWWKGE